MIDRKPYNIILTSMEGVETMPIFEYVCGECQHKFEMIVQGATVPACPSCKATKLEKQISSFAVGATSGWSSSGSPGSCGTCGDPRGPGACSMN
jgi:putative FmdB family regulatory protein